MNGAWRLVGDNPTVDHGTDVIKAGSGLVIRKAASGTGATRILEPNSLTPDAKNPFATHWPRSQLVAQLTLMPRTTLRWMQASLSWMPQ